MTTKELQTILKNVLTKYQEVMRNSSSKLLQFADDIETTISTILTSNMSEDASSVLAILHFLAADTIYSAAESQTTHQLDRVLTHLNYVLVDDNLKSPIRSNAVSLRAKAFIKSYVVGDKVVARSIFEACETAVNESSLKDENHLLGFLAFKGATIYLSEYGIPLDTRQQERISYLLAASHHSYLAAGLISQALDAAQNLTAVQAKVLSSKRDANSILLYGKLETLLHQSLAVTDPTTNPTIWARYCILIADVCLMEITQTTAQRLLNSSKYIERAILVSQWYDEDRLIPSLAARILSILAAVFQFRSKEMNRRYLYYVSKIEMMAKAEGDPEIRWELLQQTMNALIAIPRTSEAAVEMGAVVAVQNLRALVTNEVATTASQSIRLAGQILAAESYFWEAAGKEADIHDSVGIGKLDLPLLDLACSSWRAAVETAQIGDQSEILSRIWYSLGHVQAISFVADVRLERLTAAFHSLEQAAQTNSEAKLPNLLLERAALVVEGLHRGFKVAEDVSAELARQLEIAVSEEHISQKSTRAVELLYELRAQSDRYICPEWRLLAATSDDAISRFLPSLQEHATFLAIPLFDPTASEIASSTYPMVLIANLFGKPSDYTGSWQPPLLDRLNVELAISCPRCRNGVPATWAAVSSAEGGSNAHVQASKPETVATTCGKCGAELVIYADSIWIAADGIVLVQSLYSHLLSNRVRHKHNTFLRILYEFCVGQPMDVTLSVPQSAWSILKLVDVSKYRALQRKLLMSQLLAGVIARNLDGLRKALAAELDLWSEMGKVSRDEVEEMLLSLVPGGVSPPDEFAVTRMCEILQCIIDTRNGPNGVWESNILLDGMAHEKEREQQWREALELSLDQSRRREYLVNFVSNGGLYSGERVYAIMEGLLSGQESEWEDIKIENFAGRSELELKAMEEIRKGTRDSVSEQIATDKADYPASAAESLVRDAIDDRGNYALLLRPFGAETSYDNEKTENNEILMDIFANFAERHSTRTTDPRLMWRMSSQSGSKPIEVIGKTLGDIVGCIMISNCYDIHPPKNISQIFVDDRQWRRLAFGLAMEARVVVLLVPENAGQIPIGLREEILAIRELGIIARTIVVLLGGTHRFERSESFERARAVEPDPWLPLELKKAGFDRIYRYSEIVQNSAEFREDVCMRLAC